MTWVKIDDKANQHRKQLAAGPVACWLWACGLMYCNGQKARDGFISDHVIPILFHGAKRQHASKLVEVGLWERTEGGYLVHDYHEFQPTPEKAEATSSARSDAGRRGGILSGAARRQSKEASALLQESEANAKQVASTLPQRVEAKTNSDPDPDPERQTPPTPQGGRAVVPDEEPSRVRTRDKNICPEAEEIYEHWLDARQRHNPKTTRIKISPKDRKALLGALARGRTVEELKLAADGHFLSDHHTGKNDRGTPYLAFEYVLRDKNLDAFVALARGSAEELPIIRLPNRDDFIPKPGEPLDEITAAVGAEFGLVPK